MHLEGEERGKVQEEKVYRSELLSLAKAHSGKCLSGTIRGGRVCWLLMFLFITAILTNNSYAIPVGGDVIMSGEEFYFTGSAYEPECIDARVLYEVIGYDGDDDDIYDEYIYTYHIFNQDESTVGLELFSVGIFEGADAYSPGFEYGLGDEVAPTALYVIGEPPQSVTFLFMLDLIDVGQQSTLLTFWSDSAPEMGYGSLCGGGISQVGSLPAPVPEPCSFLLLGAGAMSILAGRKKL
jgi:hypothetical protein